MPGTVLGICDTEVNKADQNSICREAFIHIAGAYPEPSSGSVNKLVEFILSQMQLCGQEKKIRKGN